MTSTDGGQARQHRPSRRRWLLVALVALVSCGVIAMHSLGVGHLGAGHALDHDPGPTLSAVQQQGGLAPRVTTTKLESRTADAASMAHDGPGCQRCALNARSPLDQAGGHGGMSMCLAVLSLLVWVALRRRCRAIRTVRRLTRAGRGAFTGLVRGPPRRHAASLSELCICRT